MAPVEPVGASAQSVPLQYITVVPNRPTMMQLLTIHVRYADSGFAAVHVLCEERTIEMYTNVWEKIFELAPNLQVNLETIISDFEQALLTSIQRCLPTTNIRGCWFHFTQAVYRKWRQLRPVITVPEGILWMAMSLPLILTERFNEGLNIIEQAANQIAYEYPFVDRFVRYLQHQWAPRAHILNVADSPIRTNNIAENYNRHVTARLGGPHGQVWKFCDNLRKFIETNDKDLDRRRNGLNPRRRERNVQHLEDARILAAQEKLASGRYSMNDFIMTAVEHRRRGFIRNNN
ncbi:uncharacterized protein [Venturia canescens]|uniref:uncharacterized protein n=1 Tax=Venturia canescens TaxID=32260 RepID=UPI001C9BDDEA|nr:uncharacterized protein LOC122407545 [Venturia canescens]